MSENLSPKDYADIAALAWHVVKGASDPELPNCAQDHQHRFIFKVESVHKTYTLDQHDNGFDLVAQNLLDCPRNKWHAFAAAVKAAEGTIQERIRIAADGLRPAEPVRQLLGHTGLYAPTEQDGVQGWIGPDGEFVPVPTSPASTAMGALIQQRSEAAFAEMPIYKDIKEALQQMTESVENTGFLEAPKEK